MYFLEKDPFGFYELIHKATTLDNLKDADPFAEAYIKAHPLLDAKARYAGNWSFFKSRLLLRATIASGYASDDAYTLPSAKNPR